MQSSDIQVKRLLKVLAQLDKVTDCRDFLLDLCTPAELKSLASRWEVAQMIHDGIDYRSISEKSGCSTATITRVGRALKHGAGGYQKALKAKK